MYDVIVIYFGFLGMNYFAISGFYPSGNWQVELALEKGQLS
jgi:hypothetical protein